MAPFGDPVGPADIAHTIRYGLVVVFSKGRQCARRFGLHRKRNSGIRLRRRCAQTRAGGHGSALEREIPFGLVVDSLDKRFGALDSGVLAALGPGRRSELAAVLPSLAQHRVNEPPRWFVASSELIAKAAARWFAATLRLLLPPIVAAEKRLHCAQSAESRLLIDGSSQVSTRVEAGAQQLRANRVAVAIATERMWISASLVGKVI